MSRNSRSLRRGVTLVEVLTTSVIVMIIGLGLISSLVYMRQVAEYNKQRMVALNYARQFMEEARRNLFPSLIGSEQIIDLEPAFYPPSLRGYWPATAKIKLYQTDALGNRQELTSAPTSEELLELEVTVEWYRTGRLSKRRVFESLHTYITPDISF